jgi:hypothetical protein
MLLGLPVFSISLSLSVIATAPLDRIWRAVTPSFLSQKMMDCTSISPSTNICVTSITYRQYVDPAHGEHDDARANNNSPEGKTKRLLACSLFVQVPEYIDAENDHGKAKEVETMRIAQDRPIGLIPSLEDGAFRDNEKHYWLLVWVHETRV